MMIRNYKSFLNENLLKGKSKSNIKQKYADKSPSDKLYIHKQYNIYTDGELNDIIINLPTDEKAKYLSENDFEYNGDITQEIKDYYDETKDFNVFYFLYKMNSDELRHIIEASMGEYGDDDESFLENIFEFVSVDLESVLKQLSEEEIMKLAIGLSPVEIIEHDNNHYFEFGDHSELSKLLKSDSNIKEILQHDLSFNSGYFHNYSESYSEPNVDAETIEYIISKIKEEYDFSDDGSEEEFEFCTTVKDFYEYCGNFGVNQVKDAIDSAYNDAQNDADDSEAYNNVIEHIEREFGLSDEVVYKNDKNLWKIDNTSELVSNIDYVDDELCLLSKYSSPYNGFHGGVDESVFQERIYDHI